MIVRTGGMVPDGRVIGETRAQLRAYLQAQIGFWAKSLRESGIKLDEN